MGVLPAELAANLELRPSSALGGAVQDERPATRTWVRDVRRFLGTSLRLTSVIFRIQCNLLVTSITDRGIWNHCREYVKFCTNHAALHQFPPGPIADGRDSRAVQVCL
jgi:hypothetical protein